MFSCNILVQTNSGNTVGVILGFMAWLWVGGGESE